jgi:transposase-like protein
MPTKKPQSFRALVAAELKRQDLTVHEMAKHVDVDRSVIYRWLRGDQALVDEKVEKIFAYLGLVVVR